MAVESGISSDVSLFLSNYINRTIIQGLQSSLGQGRPQRVEQFQVQTDIVTISSQALQLSKRTLS